MCHPGNMCQPCKQYHTMNQRIIILEYRMFFLYNGKHGFGDIGNEKETVNSFTNCLQKILLPENA